MTRTWISEPGGLYFSLVLKPTQSAHLPNLTQLMALSVCRTLRALGAAAQIKWPNDVLVQEQKVCGILSEAITSTKGFEALVLGVGVNISQPDLSHVGQPATSLQALGIDTSAETVLQQILDCFFAQYEDVLQNGFSAIRTEYLTYFPYIGKEVMITHGAAPARGTVQTISPDGELVLHTPKGQTIISIGDMCI